MAGGERGPARRVEEHQSPPACDPGEFAQPAGRVRQVHDEPRGEHGVDAAVRERQAAASARTRPPVPFSRALASICGVWSSPMTVPAGPTAARSAGRARPVPQPIRRRPRPAGGRRRRPRRRTRAGRRRTSCPSRGADPEERAGLARCQRSCAARRGSAGAGSPATRVVQVDDDVRGVAPGAVGGVLPARRPQPDHDVPAPAGRVLPQIGPVSDHHRIADRESVAGIRRAPTVKPSRASTTSEGRQP